MNKNMPDELSIEELEALFNDNGNPAPEDNDGASETEEHESKPQDVTQTQIFSKRLKEKTDEAVATERETIAKTMGFESYAAMIAAQQNKELTDKGYDAAELSPIVDKIVEQRLQNDPRMKKLAEYEKREVEEFGKRELAEISKLTNGEIKTLEQIPQDVVDLWKKTGSLKTAYLQLHGEELITKARAQQSKGNTSHLQNAGGSNPASTATRPLTAEEKAVWKMFNPSITDEELSKKTMPKK